MTQKQIAAELGFKSPFTLDSRPVKARWAMGKPVPAFRPLRKTKYEKRIELVKAKRRGIRDSTHAKRVGGASGYFFFRKIGEPLLNRTGAKSDPGRPTRASTKFRRV